MASWTRNESGTLCLQLGEGQHLEIVPEGQVYHLCLVSHGESSTLAFGLEDEEDAQLTAVDLLQAWGTIAGLAIPLN